MPPLRLFSFLQIKSKMIFYKICTGDDLAMISDKPPLAQRYFCGAIGKARRFALCPSARCTV